MNKSIVRFEDGRWWVRLSQSKGFKISSVTASQLRDSESGDCLAKTLNDVSAHPMLCKLAQLIQSAVSDYYKVGFVRLIERSFPGMHEI